MHTVRMRRALRLALVVILALLAGAMTIPVAMRAAMQPYVYDRPENAPHADAALVLGASVVRGKPSPILGERADEAIALYLMGKVPKILVTGDNGALSHDEVTPVRKYLQEAGVKSEDIFLDHAGFDTYSSMYRARDVFMAKSLIIVTQDFHMPRALYVARRLGIDASGAVPQHGSGTWSDYIREIPASAKALYDLMTRRVPKYLGEVIDIKGDGQKSWY